MKMKQVIERMPLVDESEGDGEDEQFGVYHQEVQQNPVGLPAGYLKARHDSKARRVSSEKIAGKICQQDGSLVGMIRPESLTRMSNKAGSSARQDAHSLHREPKEVKNARITEIGDALMDGSNLTNNVGM